MANSIFKLPIATTDKAGTIALTKALMAPPAPEPEPPHMSYPSSYPEVPPLQKSPGPRFLPER